jgi:hypothetical protein
MDLEHFTKTIVGVCAPALGVLTSFQQEIEWHLRIISLVIGIIVGLLSMWGLIKKAQKP